MPFGMFFFSSKSCTSSMFPCGLWFNRKTLPCNFFWPFSAYEKNMQKRMQKRISILCFFVFVKIGNKKKWLSSTLGIWQFFWWWNVVYVSSWIKQCFLFNNYRSLERKARKGYCRGTRKEQSRACGRFESFFV